MTTQAQALAAVKRARRRIDRIESDYGSSSIPQSSPWYPRIAAARAAYRAAADAYRAAATA